MERIEFLELAELVNIKITEIIKQKIEFENRINEMELIDLYYLNVRVQDNLHFVGVIDTPIFYCQII